MPAHGTANQARMGSPTSNAFPTTTNRTIRDAVPSTPSFRHCRITSSHCISEIIFVAHENSVSKPIIFEISGWYAPKQEERRFCCRLWAMTSTSIHQTHSDVSVACQTHRLPRASEPLRCADVRHRAAGRRIDCCYEIDAAVDSRVQGRFGDGEPNTAKHFGENIFCCCRICVCV